MGLKEQLPYLHMMHEHIHLAYTGHCVLVKFHLLNEPEAYYCWHMARSLFPSCCIAAQILCWLRIRSPPTASVFLQQTALLISLSFILGFFAERATSERA